MTNLNPIHECNAREVEMMVGKAMCAYANWQNSLKAVYGAEDDADRTMSKQNAIACKSEYEATIRIIEMFVKESIYEIQPYIWDRCAEEFGIEA